MHVHRVSVRNGIVPQRIVPAYRARVDTRGDDEIRGDLAFLFDKGSQVLGARMATALAEVGITPRDYCVLSKAEPGLLTQREIAELALLDKTTMVVTLDHLEKAGLARRVPSPTDRRARIVQTTDAGRQVVRRARAIIDGLYDDVLGVLPAESRSALLDALVRLVGVGGPLGAPEPSAKVRSR
jgi:MarR family transcriptional regulator for hemolysin